jgi:hypothetical protein
MGTATPTLINPGLPLTLIRAAHGFQVLCGIGVDSVAWCWRRLGLPSGVPERLQLRMNDGGDRFRTVDIDGFPGVFGIEGQLVAVSAAGVVGVGSLAGPPPFVVMSPDSRWTVARLPAPVTIEAGRTMACGTHEGRAWCWGSGSLTDETFQSGAQEIRLGLPISRLAAGVSETCALTTTGRLFCWGAGVPVHEIVMPNRVAIRDLDLSSAHSCAVTLDGRGWCWGSNSFGQLGNGTRRSSSEPVEVLPGF